MSGAVLSVGLACGLFAACAGETYPEINGELANDIESVYASGAVASSGGSSGRASGETPDDDEGSSAGRGGSASVSAAGAGGAGDDGAAGSAMVGASGSAGVAGGAAGAGGAGGGEPAEVCDGFAIVQERCGTGSCHGTGSNLGTFAASEEEFASYIGEEGVICQGQGSLVDPADPENSVVVLKLSDDPPCGQPMPAGVDLLPQEDVDCIAEYIGSLE